MQAAPQDGQIDNSSFRLNNLLAKAPSQNIQEFQSLQKSDLEWFQQQGWNGGLHQVLVEALGQYHTNRSPQYKQWLPSRSKQWATTHTTHNFTPN